MAAAELTINVEARTYGLWRIRMLARVMRIIPPPLRMFCVRLVVPTAGIKIRVQGRKWETHQLQVTT